MRTNDPTTSSRQLIVTYDDDSAFGNNENLSPTTHTLLIADKWINVIQNVFDSTTLITLNRTTSAYFVCFTIYWVLLFSSHRHEYKVQTVASESRLSHFHIFEVWYLQDACSQLQKIKLTARERIIHTFTADVRCDARVNEWLVVWNSLMFHKEEKWNCREWSRRSDDDTFRLLTFE